MRLPAPLILVIICLCPHPALTQVQVSRNYKISNCQDRGNIQSEICIQASEDSGEERQAAAAAESGGVTLMTLAVLTFVAQLAALFISK